jgi:hypothetical protein
MANKLGLSNKKKHILGVSVQKFMQMGGSADFLRPFIWSCLSGLMQFRDA